MKLNPYYPVCRAFVLYVQSHMDEQNTFEYQHKDFDLTARRHSFNYWNFTLAKAGKVIYKDFSPEEFGWIIEDGNKMQHLKGA